MTADTRLTAEERAEARLVNRLRKASKVVCPSPLHAQLHAEAADALEAAEKERDEATLKFNVLAEERNEYNLSDAAHWRAECTAALSKRDIARAQVSTLAEALRLIAEPCRSRCERRPPGSHKCLPCIARDALKEAGVEP